MILLCSIAYGIASVTMKMISHRESAVTITAYQILFGSSMLSIIGWLLHGKIGMFTWKSALLFLYMALITTIAFTVWELLLKYNPVGKVAVFGFTIPVFGVLLSGLILGERVLTLQNLTALLLVSSGIVLVNNVAFRK